MCPDEKCEELYYILPNGESYKVKDIPAFYKFTLTTNMFDESEIHENCTVQILRNSITGEVSIGWWEE